MKSEIPVASQKGRQRGQGHSPAGFQQPAGELRACEGHSTTEGSSRDKYTALWSDQRIQISRHFPHSGHSLSYQFLFIPKASLVALGTLKNSFPLPSCLFFPPPWQVFSCVSILAQAYMPQLLKKKIIIKQKPMLISGLDFEIPNTWNLDNSKAYL